MGVFAFLDLGAAVALLLASLALVVIQHKHYNYSRFNARRLMYLSSAGAIFVFGLYMLGRSSPIVFDPMLRYIPINPVERVMAVVVLALILHLWSHVREAETHPNRHIPLIPRTFTPWNKTNGPKA